MMLSFDSHGTANHKFQVASITASATPTHTTIDTSSVFEIFGPLVDADHRVNVNSDSGYSLNTSVLLLHKRFALWLKPFVIYLT